MTCNHTDFQLHQNLIAQVDRPENFGRRNDTVEIIAHVFL